MKEQNLNKKVMLKVGTDIPQCIVFRNNTGKGYQGKPFFNGDTVTLQNYRVLNAGLCPGSSDLIGWTSVTITEEMVGQNLAVFTAFEVKTGKQNPTTKQENFITRILEAGGIAGVVRKAEDAIELVRDFMK
jgi:hypothetical protein